MGGRRSRAKLAMSAMRLKRKDAKTSAKLWRPQQRVTGRADPSPRSSLLIRRKVTAEGGRMDLRLGATRSVLVSLFTSMPDGELSRTEDDADG